MSPSFFENMSIAAVVVIVAMAGGSFWQQFL
jgi:hypothetical protein